VNWGDLTIDADAEKLAQVVRNLVSNAIKFTPPDGSVAVEVRKVSGQSTASPSSHTTLSDMIELRVTDTGAGISLV